MTEGEQVVPRVEYFPPHILDAYETISTLRTILAPLLDKPWLDVGGEYWICRWCASLNSPIHEPGCPVFRKDDLLGRS